MPGENDKTLITDPKRIAEIATAQLEQLAPFAGLFDQWIKRLEVVLNAIQQETQASLPKYYVKLVDEGGSKIYEGLHGLLGQAYLIKMEALADQHPPTTDMLKDVV